MDSRTEYLKELLKWVGLYTILAMAPLAVARIGHIEPSRGFWIEYGVGLGFISLSLFALQFVLTARFRNVATAFGTDAMLQFHRQAGIVAYFFLLGHVGVLLTANSAFFAFFDPTVNFMRAIALVGALILSTALIVTTLWRMEFKLKYEWWRLTHGIAAFLLVFIGLVHLLQVGYYVDVFWKQALWVGMTGIAMLLLVHARIYKPWKMARHPFEITNVKEETDSVWTIEIAPRGHDGVNFDPGQFAWVTVGESPFSMQQNPFSFSSSAERDRYEFTIKELGDFTATVKDLQEGERAYLEGPYGAFVLSQATSPELGMIVGGIGVTPVMSMLRTMRDRGDDRPVTMIYGNPKWEEVAFRDELAQLEDDINLEVVHVLEEPPSDWDGEEGFVDEDMIDRYFSPGEREIDYFICGPEPMMDVAEVTLSERDVPLYQTHSERFDIV